ncbi:amino acid ABC transporter permease [Aeromicrobium sp. CF4.19]|uniref:amino acid ABC transporter permease n=1 Tax=Aeromicrobium sp. CF4.19 TaxID=3373082 RepID=UPI003EE431A7
MLASIVLTGLAAWILRELWKQEQITPDQWEAFVQPAIASALLEGLVDTLSAAVAAIALALIFGAVLAAGRLSEHKWLRWPSHAIVEFFRAVPLLLLILFLYLSVVGDRVGSFWTLVLAIMLCHGAVMAEIFRAGLQSVPRGQTEAGYAIGLRKSRVMVLILAPQTVRSMLPAIIAQLVVVLKDTALGYIIGAPGVVNVAERIYISPEYRNPLAVGIFLAAVFFIINYALSKVAVGLEARLRRKGGGTIQLQHVRGVRR